MVVAQESAKPFVTFDGSTSQTKTTTASVVSYFLTLLAKPDKNEGLLFNFILACHK